VLRTEARRQFDTVDDVGVADERKLGLGVYME
jgi:hypothetical protein